MAYSAPTITSAGLTIPLYADVLADLINLAKSIYGSDIYLEEDSLDYQFISIFALKLMDSYNTAQLIYNNRSPATAVGSALDGVVKLNGVSRKPASYSTCQVIITGNSGTVINGGIVADTAGNQWTLPTPLTIPFSGSITVTATCSIIGSITATIGDISTISTPTQGWISVNNLVAAIPGNSVETDSMLRSRQAISTELPSQTLLAGTNAGILSVSNVSRCRVYENDTNIVDSDGLPPHSITAVVEGGTDDAIAKQIFERKGIGGYTNGTTVVPMVDNYGQITNIRFYRPDYVNIYVTVNIKSLYGYSTTQADEIKAEIVSYLNSLPIGDGVTISALYSVAMATIKTLTTPTFSIQSILAGTSANNQLSADIDILFNQISVGAVNNITVNVS